MYMNYFIRIYDEWVDDHKININYNVVHTFDIFFAYLHITVYRDNDTKLTKLLTPGNAQTHTYTLLSSSS